MDDNIELVKIGETIDNVKYLVENGLPIKSVILKHFIHKKWKLFGSNFYKLDDNNDGYLDTIDIHLHLNKFTNNTITDIELNAMIDIMGNDLDNDEKHIDKFNKIYSYYK